MSVTYEDVIFRLKALPQVSKIEYQARGPATQTDFENWTKRNDIDLPPDLVSFYRQRNGLDTCWHFGTEEKIAGRFLLNQVQDIRVVRIRHKNNNIPLGILSHDSFGTVFISLSNSLERGSVWFLPGSYSVSVDITINDLYTLCESFSSYYRLMSLHLGIICWQYAFVPRIGLPIFTRLLMARFCPDRLSIDLALAHQLNTDASTTIASECGQLRFGAGILASIS
ncbi:hypothetical protein GL50803_0014326 [Giardia duodenalis]|uniref:Uncharacterized protein n=1 Tax=Giardia intestinalis (strain ATCC 50803 / WB clone C6) TaxID=184922 RepID=D3KHZ9_GIAIC|nr:hypothetical protein GL50803_0014326 [Giardia intestinalis]KAE8305918.1 hypothetical protein GL50803_0014326 [Giardia intestinalis]